jgi:hypothetical protein
MRHLGSSTGSLKRPVVVPEERVSKRSNSFSSAMVAPSGPNQHSLSNFFGLEHSRLPRDPLTIFNIVSGDELASQLSFNWVLEERIANSCDVLQRVNFGSVLGSFTSGIKHVVESRIDPAAPCPGELAPPKVDDVIVIAPPSRPAGFVSSAPPPFVPPSNIINPQPPPLQVPPDEAFALLFGSDGSSSGWTSGGGLFGGTRSPPSPGVRSQLRDLIYPEPGNADVDFGGLEPMSLSELGPEGAVREGTCSLLYAPIPFSQAAAALSEQGHFAVASRRADREQGVSLRVTQVDRDNLSLNEVVLPTPWVDGNDVVSAMSLDAARSTVWIAAGRYVAGYAMDGSSTRNPLYRLDPDCDTLNSSLLLRGTKLCLGVGMMINVWDVDDFDASSEFSSSVMDHESVSSLSDCEGSPPMSLAAHHRPAKNANASAFAKSLNAAIGREFCRICTHPFSDAGKRGCTECNTFVCADCAHVYKLTSLGEKDTRLICNLCIPSIRKRILGQQTASRGGSQPEKPRASSFLQRKALAPHVRQQVVKPSTEHRVIGLLRADYSAPDRVFAAFLGRQCGLAWSMDQQRELRWFVGHAAAVTSAASLEEEPRVLATGSDDRSVKVWDYRSRAPVASLEGHRQPISSLCLASMKSGALFCFSGGADEVVKVWDLRKNAALYELTTGNNVPNLLSWHSQSSSLVCVTSTGHFGSKEEWPISAVHPPTHFPRRLNFGVNTVLQYDFVSLV